MRPAYCDIAILRPTSVSLSTLLQPTDDTDASAAIYSEAADRIVDAIRELIEEAAEEVRMRIGITEFQLHDHRQAHVMSLRRSRAVAENDLIVSIDPTESEFAFVSNAIDQKDGLQRGMIAYTNAATRDAVLQLLASKRVPVLVRRDGNVQYRKIPRLFSVLTPLQEDSMAQEHQRNLRTMGMALAFPDIPLQPSDRSGFMHLAPHSQS